MITKFKLFESFDESDLPKSDKYDVKKILYRLIMTFDSEEEWQEWCCDKDNASSYDDVNFDGIVSYDVPNLLDLPVNNEEITEIISELLTQIDFDSAIRSDNYESWLVKNIAKKFNI